MSFIILSQEVTESVSQPLTDRPPPLVGRRCFGWASLVLVLRLQNILFFWVSQPNTYSQETRAKIKENTFFYRFANTLATTVGFTLL